MQTRSSTWEMLALTGDFYLEAKAIIGETEYTAITAPIIDRALFQGSPTVGNCVAASMSVSIRTTDVFPKGAEVQIKMRLWNETRSVSTEWLPAGTFYIQKRQTDYSTDLVTLTCYDAMLKGAETFYQNDPQVDLTGWPLPMADVVDYIADRMGVDVDPRTTILTGDAYQITATPAGQLNEALGHIGACMGGNWCITPEGKLRLVPLQNVPSSPAEDTRAKLVTEMGTVYPRFAAVDSSNTEHYGEWSLVDGELVLTNDDPDPITDLEVRAILSRLGTSKNLTITGVTMTDDINSVSYTAGTDTGYVLAITGNPYASQAICTALYTTLNGLEYHPFDAESTIYDPAAELGDAVYYRDIYRGRLMSEKATLDLAFHGNIGAPASQEVEDEYPYKTPAQKVLEKSAAMASDARKEAVNYLSRDDSGIMVAPMTDDNRYTPGNVPTGVKNAFINNSSFNVRNGQTVLATFGESSRIGLEHGARLEQSSSGLRVVGADETNTVAMGAQSTVIQTETNTYEISGAEIDVETGTIMSGGAEITLPYELSGQNITLTISGTVYTIPVGTAYSYTGTDYSIAYDGGYTVAITNETTSAITATIQYQVTQPSNYGITAETPSATRIKARVVVDGTVVADGGIYANSAGNFGLFDAKRARWLFLSDVDGNVRIPQLAPVIISGTKVSAPATKNGWNYTNINLKPWAIIAVRVTVYNVRQYILFFAATSGTSQNISDTPSQSLYVRGGFMAKWDTNRVYVRWVNGTSSVYSTVYFDQVIGLLRR